MYHLSSRSSVLWIFHPFLGILVNVCVCVCCVCVLSVLPACTDRLRFDWFQHRALGPVDNRQSVDLILCLLYVICWFVSVWGVMSKQILRNGSEIPLPQGWELGRDYDGKVYFIDHNSKKTTWVDPRDRYLSIFETVIWILTDSSCCCRLIKPQTFADCVGNELPVGWEESYDGQVGLFYINHISRKHSLKLKAFIHEQQTDPESFCADRIEPSGRPSPGMAICPRGHAERLPADGQRGLGSQEGDPWHQTAAAQHCPRRIPFTSSRTRRVSHIT